MSDRQQKNSSTRTVNNLDDLPSPYLSGVFDLSEVKSVEIIMARGCSQNCSYCAIHESPLRYFSFERIRDEINYIADHAPHLKEILVTVADMYENVPLGEKVLPLLKKLAEERKIRVLFYVNVSTLSHDSVVRLSDCEYFDVEVGIQSLNPSVLTTCHRLPDPEKIKYNVAHLQQLAPRASIYLGLIAFLPGDTQESYWATLDWAISTRANVSVNHLRIIPGTELYDRCTARGIKVSPDYPYFVTATDKMNEEEVFSVSRLTTQIFFTLKAVSQSPFLNEEFFKLAAASKKKNPHTALAAMLARLWIKNTETVKIFEAFVRGFEQTKSLDHDLRTNYISPEDIACLEEKYRLFKPYLSK